MFSLPEEPSERAQSRAPAGRESRLEPAWEPPLAPERVWPGRALEVSRSAEQLAAPAEAGPESRPEREPQAELVVRAG